MRRICHFFLLFALFAAQFLAASTSRDPFNYVSEQFADLRILRYRADGFEDLSLNQKKLIYFLSQAGMSGRDIYYDQNYKHNLTIRRTLEEIYKNFQGDKETNEYKNFLIYLKQIWFANGIHHHYSNDKIMPQFKEEHFRYLIHDSPSDNYPLLDGELEGDFVDRIVPIIFDPTIAAKKVNLDTSKDLVQNSAVNYL